MHDPELDAVWWTFPNDRRLRDIADLLSPAADIAALARARGSWFRSDVVEYAPERSVTVRATDVRGTAIAYAKAYGPSGPNVSDLAARYDHVAAGLRGAGRPVASPRSLGWSNDRHVLVLEAMPGARWCDLGSAALPAALHHLGEAIASVHEIDPPSGTKPFGRLAVDRVRHSAELVALARPDVAERVSALASRLVAGPQPAEAGPPVLLHGDCHPKNALMTSLGLALVDLDQSGVGPAAADIGSLLARLRHGEILGEQDRSTTDELAARFLAGYASVRPLPLHDSLRWHTAAALVAERALRTVNRVNRPALLRLEDLVSAAEAALSRGVSS